MIFPLSKYKCLGFRRSLPVIVASACALISNSGVGQTTAIQQSATAKGDQDFKQQAGSLEISSPRIVIRMVRKGRPPQTCPTATIRFSVKNTSQTELRLALLGSAISAIDALGFDLIPHRPQSMVGDEAKVGGIFVVSGTQSDWSTTGVSNVGKFTVTSPGESFTVQLQATGLEGNRPDRNCVQDEDGEFFKAHKPNTSDFSAAVEVRNLQGDEEVRSFSFSDVPTIVTR